MILVHTYQYFIVEVVKMPSASKKKDLYVGKSLADLNKLVEEKLPKFTPASNAKV